MPHLEQWTYQRRPIEAMYCAPEQIHFILTGDVYDHPKFEDGRYIETSTVVEIRTGTITTESGSVYTLGDVDPDYEARYPNARARLFAPQEPQ